MRRVSLKARNPANRPDASEERQLRVLDSLHGAKALPEGGWYAIPRPYTDGALIAGDAAGFLNSFRLKGVHLAMKTGMLAAEAAFEAVRADDVSAARLRRYEDLVNAGDVKNELYPVRNVHQSFGYGLLSGMVFSGLSLVTGGWWVRDPMPSHAGYERLQTREEYYGGNPPPPDATERPEKNAFAPLPTSARVERFISRAEPVTS